MYVLEPRPGEKDRYFGCQECINKRTQQLENRDNLMSATSQFFFAAGTAISGGRSLTIETDIIKVCATAIISGFVCGTSTAGLLGWCFNKCFLRDRHCQHVTVVPVETIGDRSSPQAATAPQALPASTQVETAPTASTRGGTAPTARNDGTEVRFITSPQEFRRRFASAIRT